MKVRPIVVCLMLLSSVSLGQDRSSTDESSIDSQILKKFDAEIELELREDPKSLLFREARNEFEQSGHQSDLKMLTELRCRACIPFLLRQMYVDADGGIAFEENWRRLCRLTALPMKYPFPSGGSNRPERAREAVVELLDVWWKLGKDQISITLEDMSDQQLMFLLRRMSVEVTDDSDPLERRRATAEHMYSVMNEFVLMHRDDRRWNLSDLHPRMLPLCLIMAGHKTFRDDAKSDRNPAGDRTQICFPVIHMLATLRENGEAENLHLIVDDKRQSTATRLTCLFALHNAGENLRSDILVEILASEKNLERRLACIFGLANFTHLPEVSGKLTELLDDRHREIKAAVIVAIGSQIPAEAFPKLKRIVDNMELPVDFDSFERIEENGSQEAAEIVVQFLRDSLKDPRKARYNRDAVDAILGIANRNLNSSGPHWQGDTEYRRYVEEVIEWWDTEGSKLHSERLNGAEDPKDSCPPETKMGSAGSAGKG